MTSTSNSALKVMADTSRWLVIIVAVFALGVGWIWFSAVPAAQAGADQLPSPREGFLAPDFSLERLDGSQVTLTDLRGKAVVVNLWAAWCPPCRAEMPALRAAYEENRDRGLEIVAINTTYQDREADAAAFVREYGLPFPIALDRTGEVSNRYLLRALPTTFFVDREGVIRQVVIGGPMSEATIRSGIEELLVETP